MSTSDLTDDRVRCFDCGRDITGTDYFLSPTKVPHCARCTNPTKLDKLLADQRVRVMAVQVLILVVAAFGVFEFISSVAAAP